MEFYNNNFKSYRESQGLTHEEIGKLLGISKQAIQAWESGKNKPKTAHIKKLAQILKCSVIDISDLPPEKELKNTPDGFYLEKEEDIEISKYFKDPKNKLEKYELLAKIERQKKNLYSVEETRVEFPAAAERRGVYNTTKK